MRMSTGRPEHKHEHPKFRQAIVDLGEILTFFYDMIFVK